MAFTDAERVRRAVARYLHKAPGELADFWQEIITDADADAYQEIVTQFADRGYTLAQIDTWDRGAEFQRQIALYFALIEGVGPEAYSDVWVNKLREMWLDRLADIPFTVTGLQVNPSDESGTAGHGPLSTRDDIFSLNPTVPTRDVPTEW